MKFLSRSYRVGVRSTIQTTDALVTDILLALVEAQNETTP